MVIPVAGVAPPLASILVYLIVQYNCSHYKSEGRKSQVRVSTKTSLTRAFCMKKRLGPLKTIEINYLHVKTSERNIKKALNKISVFATRKLPTAQRQRQIRTAQYK